jgi:hypothetical protein
MAYQQPLGVDTSTLGQIKEQEDWDCLIQDVLGVGADIPDFLNTPGGFLDPQFQQTQNFGSRPQFEAENTLGARPSFVGTPWMPHGGAPYTMSNPEDNLGVVNAIDESLRFARRHNWNSMFFNQPYSAPPVQQASDAAILHPTVAYPVRQTESFDRETHPKRLRLDITKVGNHEVTVMERSFSQESAQSARSAQSACTSCCSEGSICVDPACPKDVPPCGNCDSALPEPPRPQYVALARDRDIDPPQTMLHARVEEWNDSTNAFTAQTYGDLPLLGLGNNFGNAYEPYYGRPSVESTMISPTTWLPIPSSIYDLEAPRNAYDSSQGDFPAAGAMIQAPTGPVQSLEVDVERHVCQWSGQDGIPCGETHPSTTTLHNHIKERHLAVLDKKSAYKCRWEGCNRAEKRGEDKSGFSQRGKLERHMATHTGCKFLAFLDSEYHSNKPSQMLPM